MIIITMIMKMIVIMRALDICFHLKSCTCACVKHRNVTMKVCYMWRMNGRKRIFSMWTQHTDWLFESKAKDILLDRSTYGPDHGSYGKGYIPIN